MVTWGVKGFLLFLFLLLIPTQLGKHFWPEWSYVMGVRVDYLSPTLYLLDVIWVGILVKSLIKPSALRAPPLTGRLFIRSLLLILFIGINIFLAGNRWVAGYKWLRILQVIWTIGYLRKSGHEGGHEGGHVGPPVWPRRVIPCWVVFESVLGILQVIKGGSLNGIFYWLGERRFDFNTIGIAQWSLFGRGLVRAYGTFSHPNSLAGFLLVSLMWWKPTIPSLKKGGFNVWLGVILIGLMGIMATGSRVVIVLSILYLAVPAGRQVFSIKNKIKFLILGVVFLLMFMFYRNGWVGGWDRVGLGKRMDLNISALKMIKDNPLFGVGAGNFLVKLPDYQKQGQFWLQPVHNIFLLILSEIGIVGIILLVHQVYKVHQVRQVSLIWLVILVTGMVDHYWITLPQNWWLLTVLAGMQNDRMGRC